MTDTRSIAKEADARRARRERIAGKPENVYALRARKSAAWDSLLASMNTPAVLRKLGCDGEFYVEVEGARVFVNAFDEIDGTRRFALVRTGSRYGLREVAL
jgi:hypothetical protein